MKKSEFFLIAALAILSALIFLCAVRIGLAETNPSVHIEYAVYDGMEFEGRAEIQDGQYFARISFFLEGDINIAVIVPVSREGLFQLDIASNCKYAVAAIVDSPMALLPGHGIVYDTIEVQIL